MKDRIPRYPGRVKLTPVPGSTNLFDMERADEPTQVGTPLNKTTFLTDAVAQKIGLSGDPTVSEAIDKLQLLTTVTPKIVEITESQNFIVPKAIGQRFFVLMCGGGGGMNWTKQCGGGGSGYIYRGWVTLPQGQSIPCTIGASGTKPDNYSWGTNEAGANGGTTKLGSYASAAGGYGGELGLTAIAGGTGKGGNGNAGGGGSSGPGGDGGTYGGGGGGGGGGDRSNDHSYGGKGGDGGTYGGGGGGGFQYGYTVTNVGGTGGTYGGHGATSKGGEAGDGTKFLDLLLHVLFDRSFFERPYTAGENKGTKAGGAGGGGYGSKGGAGYSASSSGVYCGGGGGGGYGGDGGIARGGGGAGGGGYGGFGGNGNNGPGGGGGLYIGISLPDGQSLDDSLRYSAVGYGAGESKSGYSNKGTYPAASGVIYLLYYPCD